jgi:hypothetical protein
MVEETSKMKNNMKLIMENWRKSQKLLNENEGVVKYYVSDDAEYADDAEDIDKYVEIGLPSGEAKSFLEIVTELVGKTLVADDEIDDEGEPIIEEFVFSLDSWGPTPIKATIDILRNGSPRFFIEEWARLNGYGAQGSGRGAGYN